jgi:amino acid adenylation domain-containing protein
MPPALPYRRRISPNERMYLAAERLTPPFVIQLVVEGSGALELAALARAVDAAGVACPGSRLVARGRDWVDGGVAPRVREIGHMPSGALCAEDAPALWERLDATAGPTCEVLLCRSERTTLVFRASHAVMDGRGVLLWASEVFRALRGEALAGAAATETDIGLLERLGPVARRTGLHFDRPSPLVTGDDTVRHREFLWHRRTLQGAHAGLVAKLAAALAATQDRSRFLVSVDMRRHDPALVSTANLSLPIFLDAARGDRWEVLHETLLTALSERRELVTNGSELAVGIVPLVGLGAALRVAVARQDRSQTFMASAVLSHLGRVDLAACSAGEFRAETVYSLPVHPLLVPLSLVAVEHAGHVELTLACARGDDTAARAEALLDRIEEAVAPDPARRWSGNRTLAPYPTERTAADLFAEQVARTPDAVALLCGEATVSYRELDRRVTAVASTLRARGVGPGALVAVLADRSIDAVAALLGVFRAGAAYVPVDPQYPEERIRFLLADSGAALCLVQRSYAPLVGRTAVPAVVLDAIVPGADSAAVAAAPTDLAYVIYTSGSTGRPKGVEIEHRQLVNYLWWARQAYDIDADTRFALFTSLSFDLTITALFLPLIAGGSVVLFPDDVDHVTLRNILTCGANVLKLTPTHLDLLSRLDVTPSGFRTLVVGGEQLRGAVAARTQTVFGSSCRIVNEYGPTETTVGCVFHVYDADLDGDVAPVPIGVPSHNTRILLLDPQRRPVATGETGEIYIAGDGLARGYRGRPELTRERFVRLADGTRAYRTGDLARIDERDLLSYLGRCDDQIKIRGHRIEPGEIEKVLEEHPGVARAVVLGRARAGHQDTVLCAYLVGARDDLEVDDVRDFLAARVPVHLVPGFFVRVSDIPATVNGKVDVRALPDPLAATAATAGPEPRDCDELTGAVTAIWSRILDVDPGAIGPDTDFYHLGGDSLTMVEMLSAVAGGLIGATREESFMRSVRPVIRRPTLATVCRVVQETQRAVSP